MRLFLSSEAEEPASKYLYEIDSCSEKKLDFVCNTELNLENVNNYGTEFLTISIIPVIISDRLKKAGGTERKYISRKNKYADIRLYINYEKFIIMPKPVRRLMYIKNIIDSIDIVIERSKGDFDGERLKKDIFKALEVTQDMIDRVGR